MRKFTIRDIDCAEVISCDDGDLILRHCKGDRLFLHYGYNSLPKKVEFNLRLSKKLVRKLGEKIGGKMKDKFDIDRRIKILEGALDDIQNGDSNLLFMTPIAFRFLFTAVLFLLKKEKERS